MAQVQGAILVRRIRQLAAQAGTPQSDLQLLQQFIAQRDESAFAALVRRHGAMVLGVCRNVLHHQQDAEDACQAAFLVLARKANTIRKQQAVSSWLHGVAYRLASKARARTKRRLERESLPADSCPAVTTPALTDDITVRELMVILHQELNQLPEKYRAPLLLCYWEGKTRDEAATQLGLSAGSFKKRLERARKLLGSRLTRNGLTLSAECFAGILFSEHGAAAAVSHSFIQSTAQAAVAFAAGKKTTAAVLSAAALLAEGAIRTMTITKWTTVFLAIVSLSAAGTGVGFVGLQVVRSQQPAAPAIAAAPIEGEQIAQRQEKKEPAVKTGGANQPATSNEFDGNYTLIVKGIEQTTVELDEVQEKIKTTRAKMREVSPLTISAWGIRIASLQDEFKKLASQTNLLRDRLAIIEQGIANKTDKTVILMHLKLTYQQQPGIDPLDVYVAVFKREQEMQALQKKQPEIDSLALCVTALKHEMEKSKAQQDYVEHKLDEHNSVYRKLDQASEQLVYLQDRHTRLLNTLNDYNDRKHRLDLMLDQRKQKQ